MTTFAPDKKRHVMITDLDHSDSQQVELEQTKQTERALPKKRNQDKCLRTLGGNFKRRSRSADCQLQQQGQQQEQKTGQQAAHATGEAHVKGKNYFNELLQCKDKQMEQLLQRLGTLHKFNEQFAAENKTLRDDVAQLERKLQSLKQRIKQCDGCQRAAQQLQQVTETQKNAHADICMLKTLVYRLNVQIEYYQDRARQVTSDTAAATDNTQESPVAQSPHVNPWQGALHTTTLAPLLRSYDEMLKDKQELLTQYKREFDNFTGELKTTLADNTRLLQQNESLRRDTSTWREERTRLQAQLDVCRAKAEAQTRKAELAREKLVEVMRCYEQRVQSLLLDNEQLQSAYARCKAELAALKSLATPQSHESIAHSLQECRELLEQLKAQHTGEKSALQQTIADLRAQQASGGQRSDKMRDENEDLQRAVAVQTQAVEELRRRTATLQRAAERLKRSRDRLRARLRIALQWAQRLEEGQAKMQNTWDALKRLESIVKHKESQVRGLHARHLEEIGKMEQKLEQKEETIRRILKGKLGNSGC